MGKVEYDGNLVTTIMLPAVSEAKSFTASAVSKINSLSYVGNSYGIGTAKEQLSSCKNSIDKYYNWLGSINEKYKNCDEKMDEVLSKIEVPKISRRNSIVK